jgi:hypothetical protein
MSANSINPKNPGRQALRWFYWRGFLHCIAVNYGPFEQRPRRSTPLWGWRP